jgi:hypothetical protein
VAELCEHPVRLQQIVLELLRAESNTGMLVTEVITELVPVRHDGSHERLLPPDAF